MKQHYGIKKRAKKQRKSQRRPNGLKIRPWNVCGKTQDVLRDITTVIKNAETPI